MNPKNALPFLENKIFIPLSNAIYKFMPRQQLRNPVLFIVYIGAWVATFFTTHRWSGDSASWFDLQVTAWIWITLLLANLAESLAESQGKTLADGLRKAKLSLTARVLREGKEYKQSAETLKKNDLVLCEVGDIIPADGEVIEGIATIDESAITGESAPVIRESGGDRSAVTAGTKVLGDRLIIRVTAKSGESFLDNIINLIEGSQRQKTPIEKTLNNILFSLTIIFALAIIALKLVTMHTFLSIPVAIALFTCLIPTTICALISPTAISGLNRLSRLNVIAKTGQAIEAAGNVDVLFLDKTGTITLGNREATEFIPAKGYTDLQLAEIAQLASIPDETPEGRSVVILAKNRYGLRGKSIESLQAKPVPFSTKSRMSGVDYFNAQGHVTLSVRKGAVEAIREHIKELGGTFPHELEHVVNVIVHQGGTPLAVSEFNRIVGIIYLKDIIKGMIKERCYELRQMGIRTVMITGDNPLTAAAIAVEAGVDDFVAEATPEKKLNLIRHEQKKGRLVAMTGDGVTDAPALAQADVGLAMNTGAQAIREASNMIDLESNPTKLIEVVTIGKQLLMTWGVLTIITVATLTAKYMALLPASFGDLYGGEAGKNLLQAFNWMHLSSAKSAFLSTVIFNALCIPALAPLALKGVPYRFGKADKLLRKNLLLYGISGLLIPFPLIKLIDMSLSFLRAV